MFMCDSFNHATKAYGRHLSDSEPGEKKSTTVEESANKIARETKDARRRSSGQNRSKTRY